MEINLFISLLSACSILTGLFTEAIKSVTNKTVKNINLVAGIVSVIIATVIGIGYVVLGYPVNTETIMYLIALVLFSWLCAMLGYDKVIQTIMQIKGDESK